MKAKVKPKTRTETFKVVKKIIRRKGYGRTPKTYCTFVIENENHQHRMRTYEHTELFKLLESTTISKNPNYMYSIYVDGVFYNDKLVSVTNPRKV